MKYRESTIQALQVFSLPVFYRLCTKLIPYFGAVTVILLGIGAYLGLFVSPADYQQGDGFRIIYVHVPAAFLSLGIYTLIFLCSVIYLVWHIKLADMMAKCSASIGAGFTLIALVTGAIWGKPMWGTWWVWDARLTSELILLFLYFGYMGLRSAITDGHTSARAGAILAIVGMVDIPIVHFSVQWWQTLHQDATLAKFSAPNMSFEMIYPLYILIIGFGLYYLTMLLLNLRTEIIARERNAEWLRKIYGG